MKVIATHDISHPKSLQKFQKGFEKFGSLNTRISLLSQEGCDSDLQIAEA